MGSATVRSLGLGVDAGLAPEVARDLAARCAELGYGSLWTNDEPNAPRVFHNSRTLSEHGVITMPYLKNLDRIEKDRFTLIGLPLKIVGAEASPVRAVAVY